MSYIEKLIDVCNAAKAARPLREIQVGDLAALDGIEKAIYVIEQVGGNCETTFLEFTRSKQKKERACAKLNAPSTVLYVGSSTTGVRKRLEQHMGEGDRRTYALHLRHWFRGESKIIVKEYDVPDEVLQIIEDDLSDRLRPAFGKRGGNSK